MIQADALFISSVTIRFVRSSVASGKPSIGKSTILDKMSKGWFNDGTRTFEGKEASELLQGEWLVDYAESCKILETPERYIKNAENFLKEFVFEKYLPGKYKKSTLKKPKNSFNNFHQREYDFDQLERQLLNHEPGGG